MVKWKEIAQLAEKHDDCFFALYSNSTLITEEVCEQVQRLGNVTFMLSIEGTPDTNDARRGEGHYAAAMRAMDLLREPIRQMWSHRSPWSICVINVNNMRQIGSLWQKKSGTSQSTRCSVMKWQRCFCGR